MTIHGSDSMCWVQYINTGWNFVFFHYASGKFSAKRLVRLKGSNLNNKSKGLHTRGPNVGYTAVAFPNFAFIAFRNCFLYPFLGVINTK